ncbi:MAG: M48 family metallopeptidase [Myxococcota bacterium]|nr:M48 family metallopeptidase [Myxococcota bacterium]
MEWEPRDPPEGINVTPTHPLSELVTLVAGIVGVTVVIALVGGFFLDAAFQRLPPRLETRIFGSFWSGLFEEATDHPRAAAAEELLDRLATHWPDNPYELRLRVVAFEEPNAFAIPGGLVAVTEGLLDELESENELAFVLGHELGHFEGRHHLRGLGRGLILQLGLAVLFGGSAGETLPLLVAGIAETRFLRDHEREADRFGLALVYREYGHVAGADDFFGKLPDADADLADRIGSWVASHPVSEDRIEALDALAIERRYPREGALTPFADASD